MGFGGYPLPALAVRPPESPLEQYGQVANLAALRQRQQLIPGQLQAQQLENQERGLDVQQKQLILKNNQITQSVLSDPNFEEDFKQWQDSKSAPKTPAVTTSSPASVVSTLPASAASSPTANMIPLHPLAQFLAEKKGLPLFGPGGALETSEGLTKSSQALAELSKTQGQAGEAFLTAHSKQLDNFDNLVEPVLAEKDAAKQAAGLQRIQSEIGAHPELYPPEATQHLGTMGTIEGLQTAANTSKVRQMLIEDATKQADLAKAQQDVIPPNGGLSPSGRQKVQQDILLATNPQIQQGKLDVAKAESAARAQVQLAMEPLRLQLQQEFGNQKDARDKIETNILKPYQDKLTDVNTARTAVSQALNNPVSARAAIFKMVGVAQPTGSHRVLPMEFTAFKYPGGVTDQVKERFNDFLKGEPWTPEIAAAANSFIDGQEQAARQNLNSGIDNVNKLYGTNVGGGLKTGANTGGGHVIAIGNKQYRYKGTGNTADINNYTEITKP